MAKLISNFRAAPTAAPHPAADFLQPQATTGELCTAMRRWSRSTPLHSEVVTALAVMAAAIKQTGALTEKCKASLIDQLDEMSAEVDQDFFNQRAEA